MTSNNIPEEFPKKQKEDRICPNWRTCQSKEPCDHKEPHSLDFTCEFTCFECKDGTACIKIPEKWLDKGGEGDVAQEFPRTL